MKKGEEKFVSDDLIGRTLTGTAKEINDKLDHLESIGVNNVALSVVDSTTAGDLIKDFGEKIISERGSL